MVKRRYSRLCVSFAILIGVSSIAFSQQTTYAKEKVAKVTYTTKMKNDKECMIVKGLSSKKKTIWSYKTPYRTCAQCTTFKCIVKKNRVYVFDYLRLLILNKNNGKRLYTVKNTPERGHYATVTNKYNCYEIGYIGKNSGRYIRFLLKGKSFINQQRFLNIHTDGLHLSKFPENMFMLDAINLMDNLSLLQ